MKQSRLMSFVESAVNIAVGFGISLLAQWAFLPLLGVPISFSQNVLFALIMTAISIARSYLLRRVFEALHIRRPLTPFMQAAIAERYRQREVEGWDDSHDDQHAAGELARAGAAYASYAARVQGDDPNPPPAGWRPNIWRWSDRWWKPGDYRRNLVKATALLIAEGERFDRLRKRGRAA